MRERANGAAGKTGVEARMHLQPDHASEFDDNELPADERLDRLLGDQELLLRLQLSSYADDQWAPAAAEFARYGLDVITGWLRTGLIFIKVFEKTQYRLHQPDDRFDDDAVTTLADDTVIAALDAFRERVLKRNRWDPTRGASLKTYFIGQCCFQFPNAYKGWYRGERKVRHTLLVDDQSLLESPRTAQADAANRIIQQAEAVEALEMLSTDTARDAARLASIGVPYADIAAELGLTDEKAVENLIGYQRRRLMKMREERAG